ncbi:Zinc dependent phospholipase C [Candidatus Methanophagaceae archaeon]|nr:Zinc dependent phospholipase C [Methanophagales archaeon]
MYDDYASLGAMGPDIYFFAPDWNDEIRDFINFIFDVYDILEPFIEFHEEYIEPIIEAVESGVDWLTGGLWEELQKTITLIEGTVTVLLTKLIIDKEDLFQFIEPNMNQGKLEKDWFWIEMGHGRHTGEYARNLTLLSGADEALRAYAYGFITHIVTDVVGHPYVNQIVGGPFRTHWHRHHLCENYMDVWAWDHYTKSNILEAKFDGRIAFGNGDLPGSLVHIIDQAFQHTYTDPAPHLPERLPQHYLSQDEINQTFILFRKYLEMATSRGIMTLPEPVPPALIPGLDSIITPPPSSSGSGGGFSWSGLWNWVKWLFKTIFNILTIPIHVLASLATYQVRYLLYVIQLLLYQIYRALRLVLVLGGYVMCEPDELTGAYAQAFTRQRPPTPVARFQNRKYPYPLNEFPYNNASDHQLYYPPSTYPNDVEFIMTESSPYPTGARPDEFIDKSPHDSNADHLATASDPSVTQKIDAATLKSNQGQLGNAVDVAAQIIVRAHNGTLDLDKDLPDWNLDADRGYGWLNWYWQPYNKELQKKKDCLSEVLYFTKK